MKQTEMFDMVKFVSEGGYKDVVCFWVFGELNPEFDGGSHWKRS